MNIPFAEVIGDPVAHSRSPAIHRRWLAELGIEGDFLATRVASGRLASFLARRRGDRCWRGCSVTRPHKLDVMPMLDSIDSSAQAVGAVNCVVPGPRGLIGYNTDIEGIAAALEGTPLAGRKACVIGAGGAARAAAHNLLAAGASTISILARDPEKAAEWLCDRVRALPLEACHSAFENSAVIVNATPMGMAGAAPMPSPLLESLPAHAESATLFDMVYEPEETPFLATGRANGGRCIGGLAMLVGQACAAFELFFGCAPPRNAEAAARARRRPRA